MNNHLWHGPEEDEEEQADREASEAQVEGDEAHEEQREIEGDEH